MSSATCAKRTFSSSSFQLLRRTTRGFQLGKDQPQSSIYDIVKHDFQGIRKTTSSEDISCKISELHSNEDVRQLTKAYGSTQLTEIVEQLAMQGVFLVDYAAYPQYSDAVRAAETVNDKFNSNSDVDEKGTHVESDEASQKLVKEPEALAESSRQVVPWVPVKIPQIRESEETLIPVTTLVPYQMPTAQIREVKRLLDTPSHEEQPKIDDNRIEGPEVQLQESAIASATSSSELPQAPTESEVEQSDHSREERHWVHRKFKSTAAKCVADLPSDLSTPDDPPINSTSDESKSQADITSKSPTAESKIAVAKGAKDKTSSSSLVRTEDEETSKSASSSHSLPSKDQELAKSASSPTPRPPGNQKPKSTSSADSRPTKDEKPTKSSGSHLSKNQKQAKSALSTSGAHDVPPSSSKSKVLTGSGEANVSMQRPQDSTSRDENSESDVRKEAPSSETLESKSQAKKRKKARRREARLHRRVSPDAVDVRTDETGRQEIRPQSTQIESDLEPEPQVPEDVNVYNDNPDPLIEPLDPSELNAQEVAEILSEYEGIMKPSERKRFVLPPDDIPEAITRYATMPVPSTRPFYLPYSTQHKLANQLQTLMEKACFRYMQRALPHVIKDKFTWEVECPEALELHQYVLNIEEYAEFSKEDVRLLRKPVKAIFWSLINLRHFAVHRERFDMQRIKLWAEDAAGLAILMKDAEATQEFLRIRGRIAAVEKDLRKHKDKLDGNLLDTVKDLAAKRAELDRLEKEAIESMGRENKEYKATAAAALERVIERPAREQKEEVKHVAPAKGLFGWIKSWFGA